MHDRSNSLICGDQYAQEADPRGELVTHDAINQRTRFRTVLCHFIQRRSTAPGTTSLQTTMEFPLVPGCTHFPN